METPSTAVKLIGQHLRSVEIADEVLVDGEVEFTVRLTFDDGSITAYRTRGLRIEAARDKPVELDVTLPAKA